MTNEQKLRRIDERRAVVLEISREIAADPGLANGWDRTSLMAKFLKAVAAMQRSEASGKNKRSPR